MPVINGEYIYDGIRVYFRHLDQYGKTNFLSFFNWAGSVREAYLIETVHNYKELIQKPILWVTTRISKEFFGDAQFGDAIEIRMVSNRIRKHSFDFVLTIYNNSQKKLIARGKQTITFVDTRTGKTLGIPPEVLAVIERIRVKE